jgi:mannose/fructose/N-acetylgalactosamine-specific phosphotransferase system component IIB
MKISVFRIDDRLIHGQIVTKWIEAANASKILVVDDKAAADNMQQMILKLAVPSGIELEILNKENALQRIREDKSSQNCLMLMRNPAEANAFVDMGFQIDKIIVGNISNRKSTVGRTKLLDYIWVEPQDVEAIRSLAAKGIKLEVKAIPEEKAKDPLELIAKKIG